ncbi:Uncharacterised protein [Vibrio cholerae]|nr:Uncharacterised protein [Vibrio cholerae]
MLLRFIGKPPIVERLSLKVRTQSHYRQWSFAVHFLMLFLRSISLSRSYFSVLSLCLPQ